MESSGLWDWWVVGTGGAGGLWDWWGVGTGGLCINATLIVQGSL